METMISEIINDPKMPKWLRYTCTVLLHVFLMVLFALLCARCLQIGMVAGVLFCGAFLALCAGSFVFMMSRIRKGKPIRDGKKDTLKRIIISCLISLTVLTFVLPFSVAVYIYESNFGERYETYAPTAFQISDFEGLAVRECTFPSNCGQKLAGYLYFKGSGEKKGVVVIAHGLGGGGHNTYMDIADYFASNGYFVFAYDATGNDKSEGSSVRGLPQGVVDLDYALRYIKADSQLKDLPIVLFGHSWGAYSVCSVLNLHPDVTAVVSGAGFNCSIDMIEAEGRNIMGDGISVMLPYVSLYEFFKFGKYADYSALKGFENSDADIMILHSSDDTVVPPQYGYDRYIEKYENDSRFTFVRFEDHGHNGIFQSNTSREYNEQFNQEFRQYAASLENGLTAEIKAEYIAAHFDKSKAYTLDTELLGKILAFYDESIGLEITARCVGSGQYEVYGQKVSVSAAAFVMRQK